MAVNLSARQLADTELVEVVSDALEHTGLDPARLCFEVTESALVHDVDHAVASLNRLKGLGVRIAIDDFGTGYATLDYVRHFSMADYLKIDRAFIDGVDRPGSQEAAIVSAAIALAKSLGFTVVAEGVETLSQMEALRLLDCELAQGYLFSRPVPLDDAARRSLGSLALPAEAPGALAARTPRAAPGAIASSASRAHSASSRRMLPAGDAVGCASRLRTSRRAPRT